MSINMLDIFTQFHYHMYIIMTSNLTGLNNLCTEFSAYWQKQVDWLFTRKKQVDWLNDQPITLALGNLSLKIKNKKTKCIKEYIHLYKVIVEEIAYLHWATSKDFISIGNVARDFNFHAWIKDR